MKKLKSPDIVFVVGRRGRREDASPVAGGRWRHLPETVDVGEVSAMSLQLSDDGRRGALDVRQADWRDTTTDTDEGV